jgi:hypothetical protein
MKHAFIVIVESDDPEQTIRDEMVANLESVGVIVHKVQPVDVATCESASDCRPAVR